MKNIIMIVLLCAICISSSFAQKISADKVPAAIKAAFHAKFLTASEPTWELEKAQYEAGFKVGKEKHSALFDKDGKWQATETEIETSQLPKSVSEACAKSFIKYKIKEAEHIETPQYKDLYEVEMLDGATKIEVQFAPDGKVIKQEKD